MPASSSRSVARKCLLIPPTPPDPHQKPHLAFRGLRLPERLTGVLEAEGTWKRCKSAYAEIPAETDGSVSGKFSGLPHGLPTPRTTLRARYVRVLVWRKACRH